MSREDFDSATRTERHFEGPDELEMAERAIARTHIALTRPADLMRQAVAEERIEDVRAFTRAVAEAGWRTSEQTVWFVCSCVNGLHNGHPVFQRTPAYDEAEARVLAGVLGQHAAMYPTFTLTGPVRGAE